jgi:hypothetical protein
MDHDVPLVVPEVNPQALLKIKRGIIANPNCSTIQMVVALKPLHDKYKIKRVVVSTYQSVSGAGKEGMDELLLQARRSLVHDQVVPQQFTKQIAFNVIPHIDRFMDDGSTKEEWKMVAETRKILDPDIKVFATCVRVPVFIGHADQQLVLSNPRVGNGYFNRPEFFFDLGKRCINALSTSNVALHNVKPGNWIATATSHYNYIAQSFEFSGYGKSNSAVSTCYQHNS